MGRVRGYLGFPKSQSEIFRKKKNGNEEWYGGIENT